MNALEPGYLKQGDLSPRLVAELTDRNGKPVPVSGADVQFKMKLKGADALTIDAPGGVLDGAAGLVYYDLQAGDTDVPGVYDCEFRIVYSDGRPETFPNGIVYQPLIITKSL